MDDDSFFTTTQQSLPGSLLQCFLRVFQSKCLIFSGNSIIFSIHLVTLNDVNPESDKEGH